MLIHKNMRPNSLMVQHELPARRPPPCLLPLLLSQGKHNGCVKRQTSKGKVRNDTYQRTSANDVSF